MNHWCEEEIRALHAAEPTPEEEVEAIHFTVPKEQKSTPQEANAALIDYVRMNADGLRGLPVKTALHVIEFLADEGIMEPRRLLKRVLESVDPGTLFTVLFNKLCEDEPKRYALLEAVVASLDCTWLEHNISTAELADKFTRAEDFQYLLDHHKEALLHSDRDVFVFECFCPDEYWRKRVRWYIAKRDYRRAWDELRKAWRGFFIGKKEEVSRFVRPEYWQYRYAVSDGAMDAPVQELFAGMIEAGTFSSVTDEDRSCVEAMIAKIGDHFRMERYAQRRKRLEKASSR